MRHVIVEGPDGSGKSTLVDFLCQASPLVQHPRASDSTTGPVTDLETWYTTDRDTLAEQPPSVYDRHPVISEPIYARFARKEPAQRPFNRPDWVKANRTFMGEAAFVIWCMPPVHVVYANVHSTPQMPGVREGIFDIWDAYNNLLKNWGGVAMWYNYHLHPKELVLDRISKFVEM